MTKKYTPPGGWAAQRQRQILWFLLMFLFFGGMGWYLQSQWADIKRIERDTQRLRQRAQELDDQHDRARQAGDDFLHRWGEQRAQEQRAQLLERALRIAEQQRQQQRIQQLRDANEQAAGQEWRDWDAAMGRRFLVPLDVVRPRGRYVPPRVRFGGEERANLDDRNRGRHMARRRIRRG